MIKFTFNILVDHSEKIHELFMVKLGSLKNHVPIELQTSKWFTMGNFLEYMLFFSEKRVPMVIHELFMVKLEKFEVINQQLLLVPLIGGPGDI